MRVFSSGVVRLRSSNPRVDPVVELGMLSDPRDRDRLRGVTRQMVELAHHPMVTAISTGVMALTTPIDGLDSDAAIDRWLRANVGDYVHAVGTCRMGARDDPAAVVDTECRVIGYDALRVCDASVMPDLPKANTHLTTVAIAERLVELMRT
jgi:choline dehydrogenase-like flavoprotein